MLPDITENSSVLTKNMKTEKKLVWVIASNVDFCENNKNLSIRKISNFKTNVFKIVKTFLIMKL